MKKLLTVVRVTEIGDTANRLVELYKKTATLQDDQFLKATFAELEKQGRAITEAVKKDVVYSQLEDADAKRDAAIRVLDKLLKGYENIPVESLKPHGEKLASIFRKYGVKIVNENYSSQSNLIDALLIDLSSDDAQAAVTALSGVTEAIANLKKEQLAFAKIRNEYEKALSEKQSKSSASSLRKPILELINKKLVTYLAAMEIVDAEKYGAFTANASNIIKSVNEAVKSRGKSANKVQ